MAKHRSSLRHPKYWPSWLALGLSYLTIYCPPFLQRGIATGIAFLSRPLFRKRFQIAARNLELCYPNWSPAQRHALLNKLRFSIGMMPIETAMSWWSNARRLSQRVHYQGMEHLIQALEEGKGVILLTAHFTSMEIGGRLVMLKVPCHVMFREMNNPVFNAAMLKARRSHSQGTILQDNPKAVIRALRQNHVVWYAPDQDLGPKPSIYARFFGINAATITATARLAKISGARIIPFIPRREKNGHYTLIFRPPLTQFPSGDDQADAQRINDILEQEIRKIPDQYFWVHRRFKTQPEGKGLLYQKDA